MKKKSKNLKRPGAKPKTRKGKPNPFSLRSPARAMETAKATSTTIDFPETTRRTKRMIAWDTGLDYSQIYVDQDLKDDLNYSTSNKKNLEGPIEEDFFADVNANADPDDLAKATTVGDLADRIYNKYIPAAKRA